LADAEARVALRLRLYAVGVVVVAMVRVALAVDAVEWMDGDVEDDDEVDEVREPRVWRGKGGVRAHW
jgi:hypothetical protein